MPAPLFSLNNNMNSRLSKLPAKILYGSGLYNINSSGVFRIPITGMSSGVPMVIIKSANMQIGNCGFDGSGIFVQLYTNLGVPTSGQVYADYIIAGK